MGGASQGQNVFQNSASALQGGQNAVAGAISPGAVPMTMNQYLNPYQGQVIGNTLGRMQDMRNQDLNMVQTQAANAGAFGGARHGLVEAELMDRYNRNMGEQVASMNQQGFNTAASLGQNRINQIMQGGGMLGNFAQQGFGMGQQTLQNQQAAGQQQQQMMDRILGQATAQYDTYANYPQQALATALAGVQGNPLSGAGTTTQRYKPGLFDYLGMGAGIMGGGK